MSSPFKKKPERKKLKEEKKSGGGIWNIPEVCGTLELKAMLDLIISSEMSRQDNVM